MNLGLVRWINTILTYDVRGCCSFDLSLGYLMTSYKFANKHVYVSSIAVLDWWNIENKGGHGKLQMACHC